MEKKKLETFIKKYSLNDTLESVIWTNDKEDLLTRAATSDRKLCSSARVEKLAAGFVDGVDVCIMDTKRLKKMLQPFGETISLSLDIDDEDKTRVRRLLIEDENNHMDYVTSERGAMDNVPSMKNIPPFDIEILINPSFRERFNKAFSAFEDSDTLFTLVMNKKKKKLEIVLGYKGNGLSNRIGLGVETTAGKDVIKNPISFTSKHLKEILAANDDVENSILKVAEAGLATIEFEKNEFKSQYYLMKVEVED